MELPNFFQSKFFKWLLIAIGEFILMLLIFQLGAFVGFHKAGFSHNWGDSYNRAFGGPKGGFLKDFEGRDLISGHGTAGTIAKIETNKLIIKDPAGIEKIINVDNNTSIKKGSADVKLTDLKIDERVVIIGSPNSDGSIQAKIIRVFDSSMAPLLPPAFVPQN